MEISGTGNLGLRIRNEPGLESFYIKVVKEGEVFTIIDGPIELDGYEWWQVQSDGDAKITGWCAGEYLIGK